MATFLAKKRSDQSVLYWRMPDGSLKTATQEEMKAYTAAKANPGASVYATKPRCEFTRLEINELSAKNPEIVVVACENFLVGAVKSLFGRS